MFPQTAFLSSFTPYLHHPKPIRFHSNSKNTNLPTPTISKIIHPTARLADRPPSPTKSNVPPKKSNAESKTSTKSDKHNPNPNPTKLYKNLISTNLTAPSIKPPHHNRLPLLGYYLDNLFDNELHYTLRKKYGPIYTSHMANKPITVLASRDFVFNVLNEKGEIFKAHRAYPETMDEIFANYKIVFDGDPHYRIKILTRLPFKAEFFDSIFLGARKLFEKSWKSFENKKNYKKIVNDISETTFRIMVGITLGWHQVEENDLDVSYMRVLFDKIVLSLFAPRLPFGLGWYGDGIRARNELMGIVKKVVVKNEKTHAEAIREMRDLFKTEQSPRHLASFVGQLMAEGKVDFVALMIAMFLQDDKTENEKYAIVLKAIIGFWFAGTETSAALITSAVHELGNRPDVLARLAKEQDDSVASKSGQNKVDSQNSELTYDELSSMPVLDAFFHEMSRLFGSGSVAFRRVGKDVNLAGYTLKEGTLLFCDLKAAMRDDDLFPDPMKFDLDRYLSATTPSIISLRKQTSMLGFGGGAHFCTGAMLAKLEFKIAIALLLRNYHLELDPKASKNYTAVSLFIPESRTPIRLTRRV